jgi:hypothetical protein
MEAADNALELAKALAGQGGVSGQDFLERMARSDELADHDGTTCGQCHYAILGAEVARERIEAGGYEDVAAKWAAEHRRRWEKGKFFKLWEKEKKAGPEGLLPWDGRSPLPLQPGRRYLVVVAAVADGRCAVYDTRGKALLPLGEA